MALKQTHVGMEALFVAMLGSPGGSTSTTLRRCGIDPKVAGDVIRQEAGTGKGGGNSMLALTPRLIAVLYTASEVAGSDSLSEAHLLQGMLLEGESLPVRYLASLGHTATALLDILTASGKAGVGDATRVARGPGDAAPPKQMPSAQPAAAGATQSSDHSIHGP